MTNNMKFVTYKNGNFNVLLDLDNGTKIRQTKDDEFIPEFSECCDVKITNYCDLSCPMCHENSSIEGLHGDILNPTFYNSLHPYTELAIGGGNPISHPDIVEFLELMKSKSIIVSMTVNQVHFDRYFDKIRYLYEQKLINGLGVSLSNPTSKFIADIKKFDNAVIHIINGIVSQRDIEALANNDLKILVLGYKQFRRGVDNFKNNEELIEARKKFMSDNIIDIFTHFKVVSFDNLALKQLDLKNKMDEKDWKSFYMGDDGNFTFYIDLVDGKYANNSTSEIRYNLEDSIDTMFKKVYNSK